MSSVHSLYNLKLSGIWNKFLKTAHEILVQRKTGNTPVMDAKTREDFWTACGDKDANPFQFWFSWPGGTHMQTGAGQEASALQNAVASTAHSLLLGHIPLAPSILLIPGCEGRSCPSPPNGEEMGRAGQGRAKITSIPCIQNLLLRATATKMIWRENKDFLADCSLKTNCTLPFVIHSGFKAACE